MKKFFSKMRLKAITAVGAMMFVGYAAHAQYCIPVYTTGTGDGDFISYVGLGTIDNATDAAGDPYYTDFTGLSTDLDLGGTYTITLGCGTYESNNDMFVWIDYNNDNDFYDAGEFVASIVDMVGGSTASADFMVPFDAVGGPLTMRVREIWNGGVAPDPCGTYGYGETEDYGIFMGGGSTNDVGVVAVTSPVTAGVLGMEDVWVTIQNFGSAEASEFNVYYQVDGGIVTGGAFLGTIPAYGTASYMMPEGWDFSADGCYEITAWTEMEIDENTDNDAYTGTVCNLIGAGAMYIYSNVFGAEPWFTTTNTDAMNMAFGAEGLGWTRSYYETVDVSTAFGPSNCFVFLEGSDFCADELENFLTANLGTIEEWVAAGGHLIINSAPNEGDGMSFGFGGVNLIYDGGASNVTAADPSHPIFNGPNLPAGTDYSGGNFSHARVEGGGMTPVIYETGTEDITLGEMAWGAGRVMFGGMTVTFYHDPDPNALNLRANIFNYMSCSPMAVCVPPSGLYVDGITDNDAVLHWEGVAGADQYRLVLWNTATGVIGKRGVYTTSYSLTDKLTPLTTYAFRVKTVCYDDLGEISGPSEWVYWTTLGRMGDVNSTVMLYPNPNQGQFTLQIDGYAENTFELAVIDALGKIVYTKSVTIDNNNFTEMISLDDLAAGMYQVKLVNSEHQLSYPVMIQR